MSRPASRARRNVGVLVGLGLGTALSACHAPGKARAPRVDLSQMSLEDIEAELDRNGELLADAGIAIAAADPLGTAKVAPETMPAGDGDGGGDGDAGGEAEGEDGDYYDEPTVDDAEAAPEMMPMAQEAPEPMMMEADEDAPRSMTRRSRASRRERRERDEQPTRCERVCDLADATCDLEAQICDLASRHPREQRYQRACERAEQQCEAAMDACDRCED